MPNSLYAQRSGAEGACQSPAGDSHPIAPPPSLREGPVGRRFGGQGLRQGFLPVPVTLRRHATVMGLTPELEQTVVALLDCGQHLSTVTVTIAELGARLGVRERTAQRRLARLVALGYLRRIHRTDETGADLANAYDLRPLWQRLDELDEGDDQTGGRVTVVSPLIKRDLRDLDPRKDPPTPIVSKTGMTADNERGTPTTGASERSAGEGNEPASEVDNTDRAAMASLLAPILAAYQEAHPAAAVGQFLGLKQRYTLDLPAFAQALAAARRRVDERLAAAGDLGPVKRPVAYLYAALAKDLSDAATAPAGEPVTPEAEISLRAAALRLAVELGTPRPSSAASRILRLFRRSGLTPSAFWTRMRQAAGELRQCAIQVRGQNGEPNGLPLFLAILQRIVAGRRRPGGKQAGTRRDRGASGQPVAAEAPAISEAHPVWGPVLEYLRGVLTRENFTRCLAARVAGQEGGVLHLVVPSQFEQAWFTRQLGRHVQGALAERGHAGVEVVFVVDTMGRHLDGRPSFSRRSSPAVPGAARPLAGSAADSAGSDPCR
jgi:hypothetical protein